MEEIYLQKETVPDYQEGLDWLPKGETERGDKIEDVTFTKQTPINDAMHPPARRKDDFVLS